MPEGDGPFPVTVIASGQTASRTSSGRSTVCIAGIALTFAPREPLKEGDNMEMSGNVDYESPVSGEPNIIIDYKASEQKKIESAPIIGCKSAYVVEPTTGKILYEKNSKEKMFPASTTKILTALVVMENCELTDMVTISKNAIDLVPSDYSNARLKAGEELSVKDLLYCLLIPSANEAAML